MPLKRGGYYAARKKAQAKHAREKRRQAWLERQESIRTEIEGWWATNDLDNSGNLEEAEFKALLTSIFPDSPPEDVVVEDLVRACDGVVTRDNVQAVVAKYRAYIRDKDAIDALFKRFDVDGTGQLSRDELLPLLKACAEASGSIPVDEVGDDDVEAIFATADADASGNLDEKELKLALATWKEDMLSMDWAKLEQQVAQMISDAKADVDPDKIEAGLKLVEFAEEQLKNPPCAFGVFGLGVRPDSRFIKFDLNNDSVLDLKEAGELLEFTVSELGCETTWIDAEWIRLQLPTEDGKEPRITINEYNHLVLTMIGECAASLGHSGVSVPLPEGIPTPVAKPVVGNAFAMLTGFAPGQMSDDGAPSGADSGEQRSSQVHWGPDRVLDDADPPPRQPPPSGIKPSPKGGPPPAGALASMSGRPSPKGGPPPRPGDVVVKSSGGCCVVS